MTKRMNAGLHPDTDPNFWNGYTATKPPALPRISVPDATKAWQAARNKRSLMVILGIPALAALVVILRSIRAWRQPRRSRKPTFVEFEEGPN